MSSQPKRYPTAGRPPNYPTPGRKMTVHISDEAFEMIKIIAQRDGVNRHFVARTALLRGLQLHEASNENG